MHIGAEILERQAQQGWGAKVIDRLSNDLRREFPSMKGLSRTNLLYMRSFSNAWPDEAIVQQLAGQIPWFHNCVLLDKVKDPLINLWTKLSSLSVHFRTIGLQTPSMGGHSPLGADWTAGRQKRKRGYG